MKQPKRTDFSVSHQDVSKDKMQSGDIQFWQKKQNTLYRTGAAKCGNLLLKPYIFLETRITEKNT